MRHMKMQMAFTTGRQSAWPLLTTLAVAVAMGMGMGMTAGACDDSDHEFAIANRPSGGAQVTIRLPYRECPVESPEEVAQLVTEAMPLLDTLASWMSRRSPLLETLRPKFGSVMSFSGPLRFGWLGKLKISTLSCMRWAPLNEKFLKNAMSHC